jgi:hypothetical protein
MASALAALSLLIGFLVAATQWQRAEERAAQQTRLRQIAEQSAAEQRRLREIAEEAMRNLEQTAAASYHTSGVFRFKLPAGFTPITGERLGVLSKAIKENLTVQGCETALASKTDFFKQRMKHGTQDYAKRSGLLPPDSDGAELMSFYESPDGVRRFGFMSTACLQSITLADMDRTNRTRVRWLIDNEGLVERTTTLTSGHLICGRPAILARMTTPPRVSRQFDIYIQEHPQRSYSLWAIQFAADTDASWLDDLPKSVEVLAPSATR